MLGGHPYVCHDITHARFCQKLDLDPPWVWKFQTQILLQLDHQSGQNLKYE